MFFALHIDCTMQPRSLEKQQHPKCMTFFAQPIESETQSASTGSPVIGYFLREDRATPCTSNIENCSPDGIRQHRYGMKCKTRSERITINKVLARTTVLLVQGIDLHRLPTRDVLRLAISMQADRSIWSYSFPFLLPIYIVILHMNDGMFQI
jgi:hypothetical protein